MRFGLVFACAAFALTPPLIAANPVLRGLEDGIERAPDPQDEPEEGPLAIADLKIDAQIHGRLATVTLEARLKNTGNEEDMEARFRLLLPDDAVVTGYALDVNDTLIPGHLIDLPKAKAVYEDEVRGEIDPGLATVDGGNSFETRVYPINPGNGRRIRLHFSAPLDPVAGLVFPLELARAVNTLSLTIAAEGYRTPPMVTLPFKGRATLARTSKGWSATIAPQGPVQLEGALRIAGGKMAEDMFIARHANGSTYFQIADVPQKIGGPAPAPARVRVYWDRSLSRKDDLLDAEAKLLKAYLEAAKPQTIDLVSFAAGAQEVTSHASADAALSQIAATLYRGGTSFEDLDDANLPEADRCLLFSDGAATLDLDASFRPGCRLSVIASAPDAHGVRLGRMAQAAKGQLIRLTADNGATVLTTLLKPAITVVDVLTPRGGRLPFRSLPSADGGWLIVGQADGAGDVEVRVAGVSKGIRSYVYAAGSNSFADSDAAGALWASMRVAELADNPLRRDEMKAIAKKHQVASPTMAFLVMEDAGQYVRADIKPPKGFDAEWMEDYQEVRKAADDRKKTARKERLESVLEHWGKRKTWWGTVFDPPENVKKKSPINTINALPAPPASPRVTATPSASVSEAAAADEAESGYQEIVVTAAMRNYNEQHVPVAMTALMATDEAGAPITLELEDVLADQPYLKALDAAAPEQRQAVLAAQEKTFGSLTAYWFETAEWFRLKGDLATSRALLLSALELPTTDDETRLIVAFRLQRAGEHDAAIRILELIAATTDFRPQPKRTLALALAARAKAKGGTAGLADLERAFTLLTQVALEPTQGDYDGIEGIALMEANALIPAIEAAGGSWELDGRLVALLDTDLRIVIEWTNDDADIDLWVEEPSTEVASYRNPETESGGTISNDMTSGYGPEEYVIRRAPDGRYRVIIDGYAADRLNPNGKGRVMVRLIRNFGRASASEDLVDAELSFEKTDEDGNRTIATLTVAEQPKRKKVR